ncbi:MAG: hypothetical protein HOQ20_11370 [Bradyrhizobium sp.]|nr:hypothetical protein [Bradyrhizobium sp.]
MRLALLIVLTLLANTASVAGGQPGQLAPDERLIDSLVKNPPHLSAKRRLPPEYKIGRCLFEVKGKRLIDGLCAYEISKGGEFEINGPRQVYSGTDYPTPDCYCAEISTDYSVQVEHELLEGGSTGPGWQAFWNGEKEATHDQAFLGPVTKQGACFSNSETKICLWKQ